MSRKYYIVTGGAGFIGSNLVAGLNARGIDRIIVVDNLSHADKFRNLVDCEIADYLDKGELLGRLEAGQFNGQVAAVLHQGACSDTMEHDGRYMMDNNYRYSVRLLEWCQREKAALLYASSASVYGSGRVFVEDRAHEGPLNVYGYSKFLFDQYVRRNWESLAAQVVGFRFFNVYGPREAHKGRMASVAWHLWHQYRESGTVRLFEGCDGYGNGEQMRDFIHVDDVVAVNLYFMDNPSISGIFNVGTGQARPFNEVALGVLNACRRHDGEGAVDLDSAVASGALRYVPFPEALAGKYQSYTRADIGNLRQVGYDAPFLDVPQGVGRYVDWIESRRG